MIVCEASLTAERDALVAAGAAPLKQLEHLQSQAGLEARQYLDLGSAYVSWSPGNGTAYPFLLHDLKRAQYEACLFYKRARFDEITPELDEMIKKKAREEAAEIGGAADRWGGRLLIAMPGFARHGRSIAIAVMDYYHAGYIGETLQLRYPDAVAVAEFLSLFGDAVLRLEADREWP